VKNHLFILKDEKKGVEWVILGQKWPKITLYNEQRELRNKKNSKNLEPAEEENGIFTILTLLASNKINLIIFFI
jgi:hypothetical protein